MSFLASEGCFWPLKATITSEAKINYAYVTTQGICNNFIEVNFCMGPMVWRPNPLFQDLTNMSLINKITWIREILNMNTKWKIAFEIFWPLVIKFIDVIIENIKQLKVR